MIKAAPVQRKFLTPGVYVLLSIILIGVFFAVRRFLFGIGAISNLNDQYPWGIWIAIDVASGVALAAGGFTTAALAHIFHRHRYEALVRPALLTALLGYTFVALGLLVDLGRFYNIWHPVMPSMWSGHSVLFEVGICVMFYLTVLYIEFLPIVVERFMGRVSLPGWLAHFNGLIDFLLRLFDRTLGRVMALFIIAGVLLSCLHQSSLGALMVIVPYKMHPLWHTPILPLLFLLSAIAVGFPMVMVESIWAARTFGRKPEMHLLSSLGKTVSVLLFVYFSFKVGDMIIRGTVPWLFQPGLESFMFLLEMVGGVILPGAMLLSSRIRHSAPHLLAAALLVVFGVVLNRINVFLVAYEPLYATERYFPAIGEIAVTAGLIATLILIYRLMVTVFPVMAVESETDRTVEGWAHDVEAKRAGYRIGIPPGSTAVAERRDS